MKPLERHMKILFFALVALPMNIFAYGSSRDLDETVKSICDKITQDIKTSDESIAIPPFLTFDNKTTAFGKILSEKLITKFSEGKKIIPVERDFIFKLTEEMKLGMTGLIEPRTVQQVGKFSGASFVLLGTIQKVGKSVLINSRLVRTETSRVEKSIEAVTKATPDFLLLLSQEINLTNEETQLKPSQMDFDKLRSDYSKLQDEFERLKQQMRESRNENDKNTAQEKVEKIQQSLSASEYFARGNIAFNLHDFDSAIKNYSKAIEATIKSDPIKTKPVTTLALRLYFDMRGAVYEEMKDASHAVSDYNQVVELSGGQYHSYIDRGNAYRMLGDKIHANSDYKKALDGCTELIERNADWKETEEMSIGIFVDRGDIYHKMGDEKRAIADYDKEIELVKSHPKSPYLELANSEQRAYYGRGVVYGAIGQTDLAKRDFQKACDLGFTMACNAVDNLR